MKKMIAKYNGAFGYIKAYLFVAGALGGAAAIVAAILTLFGAYEMDDSPLTMIITGLSALLIAFAMYAWAKKKCPPGMRKTLVRDMILAGLFASVFCVFILAIWMFKLIFHMNSSSGSTQTGNFASSYCPAYGEEQYIYLVSDNGTYAVLCDEKGNHFNVYPHKDGLVRDEAGNLYRPR